MTTLIQRSPVKVVERTTATAAVKNTPPRTYSRRDVMKHHDVTDCWIIVEEKVYDVTRFLEEHPGGEDIILEYAGGDASAAFLDKGHSRDAVTMLDDYYVGQLVQEPQEG
ncbi:cytochrome b5-like isoform X2 [Babylonia areolata]